MSNIVLQALAWVVFGLHLAVGLFARRRSEIASIAIVNLLVGMVVVMYWAQRWVGYARGVTWYWSDQLFPLYALILCVMSALGLAGRFGATWPHWAVFGLHTITLLCAALLSTFLKFGSGI